MAGAWVSNKFNASNSGTISSISPTAGNLLVLKSWTSTGGGSPLLTSVITNGGAAFTVAAATNQIVSGTWVTVYYLPNCPSGITSISCGYNGGVPGTTNLILVEISGLASANPLIAIKQSGTLAAPGTGANAITSGTASVGTIPAYILGIVTNSGDSDTAAGAGFSGRLSGNNNWFVEDRRETGSTGSYAITATAATHGGTDTYDATMLAFWDTLLIGQQPGSIVINSGDKAWLQVIATPSAGALSYQWQDNRSGSFANVIDGTGGTSQTYTTASLTTGATGRQYQCLITDSNGTVTSSPATITVLATYNTTIAAFDPELTVRGWFG